MKQKSFLAIMRAIAIAGQIGLIKLYTHYLLPAQLGEYFFYMTASYFLNSLIFIPVDYYQQAEVFKLKKSGHSLDGLLNLNVKLLSAIGILLVLVGAAVRIIRAPAFNAFCVAGLLAVILYASTAVKSFLNNQEDQVVAVIMLVAEIPIEILTFVGLEKYGLMGPLAPLIAIEVSLLLVALAATSRIKMHLHRFPGAGKHVSLKSVFKFTSPISCGAIINWLQLQGYRLVLVPLGYADAVGLFATTAAIGTSGVNAALSIYQQIYLPRMYHTHGKYLSTYLKGIVVTVTVVLIIGLGLRVEIVRIITNEKFVRFAWVLGYGILIEAGNFIINGLVVKLCMDDNTIASIEAGIYSVISVPVLYAILYFMKILNVFTIGTPLVAAQLIAIIFLIIESGITPWKSRTPIMSENIPHQDFS